MDLGAESARSPAEGPPEPLDAAVLFAPSGAIVPDALGALDRAGTLVIAGIHLSAIPGLVYDHHLFGERVITSVTANTRTDGREFLEIAALIPVETTTTPFSLDEANTALEAMSKGELAGSAVLLV
jgi:propanol-preferring alcohol dehydrogenase